MIDPVSLVRVIHEHLTTNIIQVLLCYLFGFFCLLPLCYNLSSFLEETVLRDSLTSIGYRYSAVATLTLAIPFTLDLVSDLVFTPKAAKQSNERTVGKEGFLNNTEKVLFLIGTVMLPIVAFFPEDTKYWAFIYVCCNKCQQVLIFGAVAISLSRYDNSAWTNKTTCAIITTVGIGNVILCNSTNRHPRLTTSTYEALEIVAVLLVLIGALLFLFSIIRWFRGAFKKEFDLVSKTQKISELIYPLIYTAMTVFCIVTLAVLVFLYKNLSKHNAAAILVNSLIYFSYILFIDFLTMRMVKSEVVQGLYALIESKKVYVRYISHELRTPLNAGLKLLSDDIQASTDPKDADRNDILSDANSACRTALDILNDILCFDKLENGVLVLHKQEEPVLPFIFDAVSMFSSQARECGVNLSITNPDLRNHGDSALLPTDMVVMDKFKMDQVLRNLISNALKFTRRGGTVTVSATFVPKEKVIGTRRHSAVHAAPLDFDLEGGLEAMNLAEYSNPVGTRRRSFESNFKRKGGMKNNISGKLVIVITDSGVGLSRINLKRLFKEVVQFNPEVLQAGGGSGLGLWITNMIVVMHNGKITANSAGEGFGCSFTVEIEMQRKARFSVADSGFLQITTNPPIRPPSARPHSERWTATNPSTPNSEGCNSDVYREDNYINEENLSKPSADEDSKDDSYLLKETIDLVNRSTQKMNIGDSIISVGSRKIACISVDNEDSKYDSYLSDALKATIGLVDSSSQKLNSMSVDSSRSLSQKRDGIISGGKKKAVSISEVGVGTLSGYNSRRESHHNSIESRRPSCFTKQNFDILIVDDSGLNRRMLCRLLRSSGYVFDEAEDGLLARDKVKAKMSVAVNGSEKGSFGVILMDYIMPNMDGPTATRAIRDLGYTAPIFGLTGNALDSDITYFLSCGANEVMTKPFDLSLFQELMKKYEKYG